MKKGFKAFLVAAFIVPCAVVLTACGGSSKPPNYEAVAKSHTHNVYESFYIKESVNGYFANGGRDFDAILDDYFGRLDAPDSYFDRVSANDEFVYAIDYDIMEVFGFFLNDQRFILATPDAENKFVGTMTVMETFEGSSTPVSGTRTFSINEENGAMTVVDSLAYAYGSSAILKYSYRNGAITVEVDVQAIVRRVAREFEINEVHDGRIPYLAVQFRLS